VNQDEDLDDPAPGGAPRVGRLDSLQGVCREQAKVYRLARRNEGNWIDAKTAARLSSMLDGLARSLMAIEIERKLDDRLRAIEARLGVKR
jgi:hypothetical protein